MPCISEGAQRFKGYISPFFRVLQARNQQEVARFYPKDGGNMFLRNVGLFPELRC
jgi:hypothetical protein